MKYGIISGVIHLTAKRYIHCKRKIVRLMIGVKSIILTEILTLPCEYIFPLINFITNNEEHIQINADVHSVNTRHTLSP
jgi:hypothetical protein